MTEDYDLPCPPHQIPQLLMKQLEESAAKQDEESRDHTSDLLLFFGPHDDYVKEFKTELLPICIRVATEVIKPFFLLIPFSPPPHTLRKQKNPQ